MRYEDQLRAYADATRPPPDLAARLGRRRARPPWRGAAVLAAAAAIAAFVLWPRPVPVEVSMAASGAADLGDAASIRWTGTGIAEGDSRHLSVRWQLGDLDVEVEPGRGVDLRVSTDEAEIRVIGTGFSVRRDAFGTSVAVRHGAVAVTCGGEDRRITAGEQTVCLPVTPASLLGRARAQEGRGDPVDEVLFTVDAGLRGAAGPVAIELWTLRAATCARAGRWSSGIEAAEAALAIDGGGGRRAELLVLAEDLSVREGGCARARPFSEALAAASIPSLCPLETP